MTSTARTGPLAGLRILELGGIGPGPLSAMLLADLGAEVLRIDRTGESDLGTKRPLRYSLVLRNRPAIALDLKDPAARRLLLRLARTADGPIDPFRPGVIERLGLRPEVLLEHNARIVVGRMTGWGQTGPMAKLAGHDLNYIGVAGVLNAIGRRDAPPTPPLNLVGDYGGGALYLAFGMLAALLEAKSSGRGQVVDAAMFEGAASLAMLFWGAHASGEWHHERGTNYLDSGSPWYDSYRCADDKWLAVAAIEDRFYDNFIKGLGLGLVASELPARAPEHQDALRQLFAARIAMRTRDDWMSVFERLDACVGPVLDFDEAPRHPHAVARGSFVEIDGVTQPAPVPRFSRTVPATPTPPAPADNRNLDHILSDWLEPGELPTWQAAGLLAPIDRPT